MNNEAIHEASNADQVPTPEPQPKQGWQSTAGPIQTKRTKEALDSIRWEGNTYTEILGVIGGEEHTASYTKLFGGCRSDASDAMVEIGNRFGWSITRENYSNIIAACAAKVTELKARRPVIDKRRTPEEDAKLVAQMAEREAARKAQSEAELNAAKIEQAARLAALPKESAIGAKVSYNAAKNGVEIRFPGKPEQSVLSTLKAHKFHWFGPSKVWYKRATPEVWALAHELVGIAPTEYPAHEPDRFDMQVEDQMTAQCGL